MKPYNGIAGKKIGSKLWVHKSIQSTVLTPSEEHQIQRTNFEYDVVRVDINTRSLALIKCVDFDNAHEPILKSSLNLKTGKVTNQGHNPLVYHHKWLFVRKDYAGFCYEQAIERSKMWRNRSPRTRHFTSQIGRLDYWTRWIADQGLEL